MISICVSVYNGEKSIRQCMEMLVNQTVKDKEICVVDDGSTDNTYAVLEEYDKKYDFVHISQQENKGTSIARLESVKMAKGDYIGFMDVDDSVELDMYERMLLILQQGDYDIVECRAENEGQLMNTMAGGKYDGKEFLEKYIKCADGEKLVCALWCRIYKKPLFDGGVFLEETGVNNDDTFALPVILSRCKQYFLMPQNDILYHYNADNEESDTYKSLNNRIYRYVVSRKLTDVPRFFLRKSEIKIDDEIIYQWQMRALKDVMLKGSSIGIKYKFLINDLCRISGLSRTELERGIVHYLQGRSRMKYMCVKLFGLRRAVNAAGLLYRLKDR